MENGNIQTLAEKIAHLLQSETNGANSHAIRSNLERINQRLDRIEAQLAVPNQNSKTENQKSAHSSQEKFLDLEELAVDVVNGLKDEKACPYEPTGKPCDHCAMCNSRGF